MKHFRIKKLVKSGLQLKLIAVFLCLASVAALFQVVLLNRSLMRLARELPTDSAALLERLPGLLVTNVALTVGILLPLMFVVGVLVTHRVAGPIYRFERYLDSVAKGTDTGPCKIRKGDEMQSLCDRINAAVEHLRETAPATADEPVEEAA